ncbi:GMP 5'-nucleotidase [Schizosaccharomyces pombe]|uniref:5'-deoxynucleotidase hdd1 n=1 Tax=Schizosaccharomyces pombe (strain 972 / ATCC 24843) TaxID=284812 RepID=HDD1_SCHPO|nr:putative metal-dependent HD domain-containing phosphohydrolase [Schizosaccharomyces pombe]P87242.1 RecName: Full=5'-deoxynucleotidase hdd1 [Schizosaccharomyces pombe 972h-]CAB09764.1 HD domain metal dependent phosphohydrolase (predicted) [Schizosaccharomyces pombe]|eukprot:NP_587821.1 putative metal-dependent HD domain-containing phosphohydrolase [Schizosaccharomyces pombe]
MNAAKSLSIVPFLDCLSRLKTTPRTGWLYHGIEKPESIADHMYRMGILTMLCNDPSINKERCLKIAVVHDMAESIVGDITPHENVSKEEKHRMESEAMVSITQQLIPLNLSLQAEEIKELFLEYESASTPEAKFVKDIDKFEMIAQMFEYERKFNGEKDLSQFTWAGKLIQHPLVKGWLNDVLQEREQFWASVRQKKL